MNEIQAILEARELKWYCSNTECVDCPFFIKQDDDWNECKLGVPSSWDIDDMKGGAENDRTVNTTT